MVIKTSLKLSLLCKQKLLLNDRCHYQVPLLKNRYVYTKKQKYLTVNLLHVLMYKSILIYVLMPLNSQVNTW